MEAKSNLNDLGDVLLNGDGGGGGGGGNRLVGIKSPPRLPRLGCDGGGGGAGLLVVSDTTSSSASSVGPGEERRTLLHCAAQTSSLSIASRPASRSNCSQSVTLNEAHWG